MTNWYSACSWATVGLAKASGGKLIGIKYLQFNGKKAEKKVNEIKCDFINNNIVNTKQQICGKIDEQHDVELHEKQRLKCN